MFFIFLYFDFYFDFVEPPDCADIVCDLNCPADSKVVRIDSYDQIILVANASEVPPLLAEPVVSPKRKRAILARGRASIALVPNVSVRRRRDANDSLTTAQKCCECKCDFSKCPDFKCPPNQYKLTVAQATKVPGSCCAKFECTTQKPTCYSQNLQKHFDGLEQWKEDACTHCECSETGEANCETPICKALSCEKKRYIEGECCPVCDISDSKFCEPDIDCDRHCRNGFERDPVRDCAICTCAKSTAKTTQKTTIPKGSGELEYQFVDTFDSSTIANMKMTLTESINSFTFSLQMMLSTAIVLPLHLPWRLQQPPHNRRYGAPKQVPGPILSTI